MEPGIRNLFDQYQRHENRLSHALATALSEDRRLLRSFVRRILCLNVSRNANLRVVEQRIPGEPEQGEEEAERRGLPDICLYDGEWIAAIESKIEASMSEDQLRRHQRTLERRRFSDVHSFALVACQGEVEQPAVGKLIRWPDVYEWACRVPPKGRWARRLSEFIEIAESKMIEEGYLTNAALTQFSGVPFGPERPYTPREARRLLKLAMGELRKRKDLEKLLGADLKADSHAGSWDMIPLKAARNASKFTDYPHLSFGISEDDVSAAIVIPDKMRGEFKRNMRSLGWEGFERLSVTIARRLSNALRNAPGSVPFVLVQQRHWIARRSKPITDAKIEVDLRTIIPTRGKRSAANSVKFQPDWLEATFKAFAKKRSNIEIAFGAKFSYERSKIVAKRKLLDRVEATWLACKPLMQALLGSV